MKISFIRGSIEMLGIWMNEKPIITTSRGEPTEEWPVKRLYRINYEYENEIIEAEFVGKSDLLLINWMNYRFSDDQRKEVVFKNPHAVDFLSNQADKVIRLNLDRIKNSITNEASFGRGCLCSDEYRQVTGPEIEIQNFLIKDKTGQILYAKGGVALENDRPMRISEYRRLLEWKPNEYQVILINLNITGGQKLPSRSNPEVILKVRYSENISKVIWSTSVDKYSLSLNKWFCYFPQIIKDNIILDKLYSLLREDFNKTR